MYELQAVKAMTGKEFLSVIDPLSRDELTSLLAMFWGADPAAFADALNCLSQRRAAPVITDSERTCDQANPETGAWCHKRGGHDEHRDTDGETWKAAQDETPAAVAS